MKDCCCAEHSHSFVVHENEEVCQACGYSLDELLEPGDDRVIEHVKILITRPASDE